MEIGSNGAPDPVRRGLRCVVTAAPGAPPARGERIVVRRAAASDFAAFLAMGQAMAAESEVAFPPIDVPHARATFETAVARPGIACPLIAEAVAEDRITGDERAVEAAGMLVAALGRYLFSPEAFAAVDLLHVRPHHRGGPAARALIRAFEDWAYRVGARYAALSAQSGIAPVATGRFFARLGYAAEGAAYRKALG